MPHIVTTRQVSLIALHDLHVQVLLVYCAIRRPPLYVNRCPAARYIKKVGSAASEHLLTGLLIAERGDNHDLIAMVPVHRRCYGVLCGQLQRVNHPQDLHVTQRTKSRIAAMSCF